MLVLAREVEQWIDLRMPDGRLIGVQVTDIRGNGKVRLGFDAPPDVQVNRREVRLRIERANAAAAAPAASRVTGDGLGD